MNQLTEMFDGQQLRIIEKENEPWFVAKDVAEILGYRMASDLTRRLEGDEKGTHFMQTQGGKQNLAVVNESGLYTAIFHSNRPEAKHFKRWVTHDVLPSIRKHGAYATPETIENVLNDPDFGIQLLTNLKQEREEREKLERQRKRDEPYTTFGKVVSNSSASLNVGAFAKMMYDKHGVRIGRNKMFQWLRDKGYLIKAGRERNNPKQKYIEQGLFDTTVTVVSRTQGDVESITTLITGKGQVKLAEQLTQEYKVVI